MLSAISNVCFCLFVCFTDKMSFEKKSLSLPCLNTIHFVQVAGKTLPINQPFHVNPEISFCSNPSVSHLDPNYTKNLHLFETNSSDSQQTRRNYGLDRYVGAFYALWIQRGKPIDWKTCRVLNYTRRFRKSMEQDYIWKILKKNKDPVTQSKLKLREAANDSKSWDHLDLFDLLGLDFNSATTGHQKLFGYESGLFKNMQIIHTVEEIADYNALKEIFKAYRRNRLWQFDHGKTQKRSPKCNINISILTAALFHHNWNRWLIHNEGIEAEKWKKNYSFAGMIIPVSGKFYHKENKSLENIDFILQRQQCFGFMDNQTTIEDKNEAEKKNNAVCPIDALLFPLMNSAYPLQLAEHTYGIQKQKICYYGCSPCFERRKHIVYPFAGLIKYAAVREVTHTQQKTKITWNTVLHEWQRIAESKNESGTEIVANLWKYTMIQSLVIGFRIFKSKNKRLIKAISSRNQNPILSKEILNHFGIKNYYKTSSEYLTLNEVDKLPSLFDIRKQYTPEQSKALDPEHCPLYLLQTTAISGIASITKEDIDFFREYSVLRRQKNEKEQKYGTPFIKSETLKSRPIQLVSYC